MNTKHTHYADDPAFICCNQMSLNHVNATEPKKAKPDLRSSVTGSENHWQGCIRYKNKVIWSCGHSHTNRDQSTQTSGQCASDCARNVLKYAQMDDAQLAQHQRDMEPFDNRWITNPREVYAHGEYLRQKKSALARRDEARAAIAKATGAA